MAMNNGGDTLSPREWAQFNNDKEVMERQMEHALRMKDRDIEVQKLEAKWTALFRIPVLIVKLPVLMILGVAFCIAVARKHELSESFWNYMR